MAAANSERQQGLFLNLTIYSAHDNIIVNVARPDRFKPSEGDYRNKPFTTQIKIPDVDDLIKIKLEPENGSCQGVAKVWEFKASDFDAHKSRPFQYAGGLNGLLVNFTVCCRGREIEQFPYCFGQQSKKYSSEPSMPTVYSDLRPQNELASPQGDTEDALVLPNTDAPSQELAGLSLNAEGPRSIPIHEEADRTFGST